MVAFCQFWMEMLKTDTTCFHYACLCNFLGFGLFIFFTLVVKSKWKILAS
jgi:hypothetical protein